MTSLANKLLPEVIKNLMPYASARRLGGHGQLFLNANEMECKLAYDQDPNGFNRYPDTKAQQVSKAYQAYCRTEADCLAVRGADEAIDLLVRTFCVPGQDRIVICPPTYGMYEVCANAHNVGVSKAHLTDQFALNITGIQTQLPDAKLLFICSPNNPTGNLMARQDLITLLSQTVASHIVVVDEAYIEFSTTETVMPLLATYPNLVVLRTLSKAFGLAGIRCGFVLGQSAIIDALRKVIAPYPLPDPSADIALTALQPKHVNQMWAAVDQVKETRDWFVRQLVGLPSVIKVWPSESNFVLVKFQTGVDAYKHLEQNGIIVRRLATESEFRDCVRISVGLNKTMRKTKDVLRTL